MTEKLTDEALQALTEEATTGPWKKHNQYILYAGEAVGLPICTVNTDCPADQWQADASLIALAPALADEVLELRARVAAADTLASTLEIWKEEPRNCPISKALQGYLASAQEARA